MHLAGASPTRVWGWGDECLLYAFYDFFRFSATGFDELFCNTFHKFLFSEPYADEVQLNYSSVSNTGTIPADHYAIGPEPAMQGHARAPFSVITQVDRHTAHSGTVVFSVLVRGKGKAYTSGKAMH